MATNMHAGKKEGNGSATIININCAYKNTCNFFVKNVWDFCSGLVTNKIKGTCYKSTAIFQKLCA